MMKNLIIHQQRQQLVEESMSNLTSASGEAISASSSFASPNSNPNPNPAKRKRNLPGNPDPDAQVIALSPKSLMATNRFLCEICNKGFQRDQNLELHRRGHNLPWKLKQRTSKEVTRKKVYICPETSCVHHDPSRALGDLTGIKKHFSRKHGEKKWKCDKCSKKYAVQSDWKAHSKICGTREYRCDCGTLFSRRDSFITHRAFCDALAEESAKTNITTNKNHPIQANNNNHHPLLFSQIQATPLETMAQFSSLQEQISLKKENSYNHELNMRPQDIPPWLACRQIEQLQSSIYSSSQEFSQEHHQNNSMNPPVSQALSQALSQPSAHMSATALLQKAAQMGATMSSPSLLMNPGMIMASSGFDHGPFGEAFMVNSNSKREGHEGGNVNNNSNSNDGMTTRDFLGLRGGAMSHRDMILNMAGLDHCMSNSSASFNEQTQQNNKPWN